MVDAQLGRNNGASRIFEAAQIQLHFCFHPTSAITDYVWTDVVALQRHGVERPHEGIKIRRKMENFYEGEVNPSRFWKSFQIRKLSDGP